MHNFVLLVAAILSFQLSAQVKLEWEKKPEASYIIEVSDTKDFKKPFIKKQLSQNSYIFWPQNTGVYFWRVRLKFPGVKETVIASNVGTIEVDVKPVVSLTTKKRFVSSKPRVKVNFQWSKNKYFQNYEVQIRKKDRIVTTQETKKNYIDLTLKNGDYEWKVILQNEKGEALAETNWEEFKAVYIPPEPPKKKKIVKKVKPLPKPTIPFTSMFEAPTTDKWIELGVGDYRYIPFRLKSPKEVDNLYINKRKVEAFNNEKLFTLNLQANKIHTITLEDKFKRKVTKKLKVLKNRNFDVECNYHVNLVTIQQSTTAILSQLLKSAEFNSTSAGCQMNTYIKNSFVNYFSFGAGAEYGFSELAQDEDIQLENITNVYADVFMYYEFSKKPFHKGIKTSWLELATGLQVAQYPFYFVENNIVSVNQDLAYYLTQKFTHHKKWDFQGIIQKTYLTFGIDVSDFSSEALSMGTRFDVAFRDKYLDRFAWHAGFEFSYMQMSDEETQINSKISHYSAFGGVTWYY
jgi:hypothetical protein